MEKQASIAVPRGTIGDGRVAPGQERKVISLLQELFENAEFDTTDVIIGLNSSGGVFMTDELVPVVRPEDYEQSIPLSLRAENKTLNPREMQISFTIVDEVEDERMADTAEVLTLVRESSSPLVQRRRRAPPSGGALRLLCRRGDGT
ncbi:hypothetical protein [Nocardioides yefusunii]|uniref:Uncharacterized protein n=1 Tax=Nocardioides yefusunii TaxID=2500546 RepID=A0ABW1QW65_9ACTN|nr:hypothetical protein [Nocardioides yefusunii]